MLRKISDVKDFPFSDESNCYIEVHNDGTVSNIPHKNRGDLSYLQEAYVRTADKTSKLYVAWPGKWSTDLFFIDDLAAFANAFGLSCDDDDSFPSFQWRIADYDKREGRSVWVDIMFTDDSEFELSQKNIRMFAAFAHKHLGWNIAVSKGISGGRDYMTGEHRQTITVQRNTLAASSGEFILTKNLETVS